MASTSRCRAASGSTDDSRRLARPSAFTGTIAHVRRELMTKPPGRSPALAREPVAERQALPRQRYLVVERAHQGIGHEDGEAYVFFQRFVLAVDDESVDQPRIMPRNARGCQAASRVRP